MMKLASAPSTPRWSPTWPAKGELNRADAAASTPIAASAREHWHGATPEDFMEHIAMFENSDDPDATTDWGPHVSDEEYNTTTQQ
jgi:hypothetical protein